MAMHSRKVYQTSEVPAAQQFSYWRESICEAFAALDAVAQGRSGRPFSSLVEVDRLECANVSLVQSMAQRVHRGPAEIRRDPRDRLFVNLMLGGWSRIEQGGDRSVVRPGDVYVVETTRPYLLDHPVPFRLLCLDLPREAFMARGARKLAFAQGRSTAEGRGALAVGLLRQLRHGGTGLDDGARDEALAVALHWLRATLESPGAQEGLAPGGLVRLWRQAVDVIEQRVREPSLGPAGIAAELKVSPSYLHKAFAQQGSTVSDTVRDLRLQRCARELAVAPGRRKIAAIASDWGFNDIPHFNRLFKRRYGHTPGAHRRAGGLG